MLTIEEGLLHRCTYEVDTETGERETLECWVEYCHIPTDICSTTPEPTEGPDGLDITTDEGGEVLPPTPSDPSTGGITDWLPGEQEVLPTPPGTISDEDTGITDRSIDEREVLPTTPTTPSPFGETSPLQPPPPLTIEKEEDEQTEPTPEEQEQLQKANQRIQQYEITPEPEECGEGETFNERTGICESEQQGQSVQEARSTPEEREQLQEANQNIDPE